VHDPSLKGYTETYHNGLPENYYDILLAQPKNDDEPKPFGYYVDAFLANWHEEKS
jgi:hypothetical protein